MFLFQASERGAIYFMLINTKEAQKCKNLGGTGNGTAVKYPVIIPDQSGVFTMATLISLDKRSSIGYHKHEGTEEIYHIISGTGLYREDGEEREVKAGDILLCRMGCSHGLTNLGEDNLVLGSFIAQKLA